jgi:hypothetical protein
MSQLQELAKPHLVPSLRGERTVLMTNAQRTISTWAAMMIMVSEFSDDNFVAVPARDRRWLKDHRIPPSRWQIWIGRHAATGRQLFTHNVMALAVEKSERVNLAIQQEVQRLAFEGPATPNTQTSTICVGNHLVIYAMSSIEPWKIIRQWKLPPEIDATMVKIWPIRNKRVIWPPGVGSLTDAGLDLLSMHFMDTVERIARNLGIIE